MGRRESRVTSMVSLSRVDRLTLLSTSFFLLTRVTTPSELPKLMVTDRNLPGSSHSRAFFSPFSSLQLNVVSKLA